MTAENSEMDHRTGLGWPRRPRVGRLLGWPFVPRETGVADGGGGASPEAVSRETDDSPETVETQDVTSTGVVEPADPQRDFDQALDATVAASSESTAETPVDDVSMRAEAADTPQIEDVPPREEPGGLDEVAEDAPPLTDV